MTPSASSLVELQDLEVLLTVAKRRSFRRASGDLARLDRVELADAVEQMGGEGGWLAAVLIEDAAPEVRPARDLGDAAGSEQLLVPGIGVGLEMAGEPRQLALRVTASAAIGEMTGAPLRRFSWLATSASS